MKRLFLPLAAAAMAMAALQTFNAPAVAQTAPTAPPIPNAQATYAPTTAPTPNNPPGALPTPASNSATVTIGKYKAAATPPPPKEDAYRVGISGVWEVALQQTDGVEYTHFRITQTGSVLTGTYLTDKNKRYPLSGSIDGKTVRLVVSMPDGSALIFNATEDANTDMVGTVDNSKDMIGFTAAYRPKYKWTDNINPSPGGGIGGGTTPY